MAERIKGEFLLDSNYDISIRKPLDARSLVPAYEALTIKDNWVIDGKVIAYNGMIVAVANTGDSSKNGIYFLFDQNTSKLKGPNVEDEANWHKVGETSDISDFAARISSIESELEDFKDRLEALENDSDIITYGYRSGFPGEGEPNKLYIAADEGKSYIWFNNDYLLVSGNEYEEPEVIYGGSAN